MKIDKRKKYVMIVDVETTNNAIGIKGAPNDGLVYDIGYTIADKKGNIYQKQSYAIAEIFNDKELMDTAYYKKKLPLYYERIKQKQMQLVSIWQARREMRQAIQDFNIKEVWAYNASFDRTTLNNTVRLISGSSCRWFFPFGTKICDIWHVACQVLGLQKTFQWENVRNANGNLITNAERMFAYLNQEPDFKEEHTGLADAIVETQILARCLSSHKTINKNINRACWRIPQQA